MQFRALPAGRKNPLFGVGAVPVAAAAPLDQKEAQVFFDAEPRFPCFGVFVDARNAVVVQRKGEEGGGVGREEYVRIGLSVSYFGLYTVPRKRVVLV